VTEYYWRPIDDAARSGQEVLLQNSQTRAVASGLWNAGAMGKLLASPDAAPCWDTMEGGYPAIAFDLYCPLPPLNLRGDTLGRARYALTMAEAARYLDCSRPQLDLLRRRGEGPAWFSVGPRTRVLYKREDLDAWMTARKHTTQEAA